MTAVAIAAESFKTDRGNSAHYAPMFEIVLTGLWFGLVFNAAPGPIFAETLRRGVRGGFRPALAVQVGSLVGDAVWAILGLAGAAALLTQDAFRVPIAVIGSLVLALLGLQGIVLALRPAALTSDSSETPLHLNLRGPLLAGVAMSLNNVWNLLYWSGAGAAVGALFVDGAFGVSLGAFFAAFMATSIAWCFICASLAAGLRKIASPFWACVIELTSGATLVVVAVVVAARAIGF